MRLIFIEVQDWVRLRPRPQKPTNITSSFPYTGALTNLMLMILLLGSLRVSESEPVLLSKFEKLLVAGITDNMIMKMEAKRPMSALPALTFSDTDMIVPDVTEGDIEDAFRHNG